MDLIKMLQRMNTIYEIRETYYIDIIWFEAHKTNFSELEPTHTWVNKIRIRTCIYVHFDGTSLLNDKYRYLNCATEIS